MKTVEKINEKSILKERSMSRLVIASLFLIFVSSSSVALAHGDGHHHAAENLVAPNGGDLVKTTNLQLEFVNGLDDEEKALFVFPFSSHLEPVSAKEITVLAARITLRGAKKKKVLTYDLKKTAKRKSANTKAKTTAGEIQITSSGKFLKLAFKREKSRSLSRLELLVSYKGKKQGWADWNDL